MDTTKLTEIVRELASGAKIYAIDEGGYDGWSYELRQPSKQVNSSDLNWLLSRGWIESRNTCYILTDEGKKAYLRSVDELGDGELVIQPE